MSEERTDAGTCPDQPDNADAPRAPVLHLFVGARQYAATVDSLTLEEFLRCAPDSFPLSLVTLRSLVPAGATRVSILSTRDGAHDVSIWGDRVQIDQDDVPVSGHVLEVDDEVVWASETMTA